MGILGCCRIIGRCIRVSILCVIYKLIEVFVIIVIRGKMMGCWGLFLFYIFVSDLMLVRLVVVLALVFKINRIKMIKDDDVYFSYFSEI
jgi:hypothetical protein